MRNKATTYLSWAALLAAAVLWAGVGYFVWTISSEESARAARVADLAQESVQQASALRLHTIAREIKDASVRLEEIARTDANEILDSIEAVSKDAGVSIEIDQALSASPPGPLSPLHAVSFVIEAEGSFAKVIHAAALLESLRVPSFINELQFERLPQGAEGGKGKGTLWRMVAHMQFLTTVDVSS